MSLLLLAQDAGLPGGADTGLGEGIAFWILGPVALAGALGMVFARNAVHSALCLAGTMLSLGLLYMAQGALFLGFVQIIVYTGAIMMLFLFVLMMVGRDSSDSVVEVIRGQRLAAALLGIGFAVLMVGSVGRALTAVEPRGLAEANTTNGGNVGKKLFTDYLFAFELTSALLITAALGAMILAFVGRDGKPSKKTQKELVEERFQEFKRVGSIPGPGVFATANSVATPALLPDGSVSEESLFEVIEATDKSTLSDDVAEVAGTGHEADAHALKGSES